MYVPHLTAFLQNLGLTPHEFAEVQRVAVPRPLLSALLQAAAEGGAFNEHGYLLANPDVSAALRHGRIESARQHYRDFGYLEGRFGATPEVDELWYLTNYPDVAAAIRRGQLASAVEHFRTQGAAEGRAPNEATVAGARGWRTAFGRDD